MFDIAIVGGNLAGGAAALKAIQDNTLSIALIERNKKPYTPPHCGEVIYDVEKDWLNLDKIKCKYNELDQVFIHVSNTDYQLKLKQYKPIIIDRYYFEKKLLEEAKRKHVELFLGTRVSDFKKPNTLILEDNNVIKAKIIIDASGISCIIGKKIGIDTSLKPKDIGICIQSLVKGNFEKNKMTIWFHKPYAPFGYGWVFPKSNKYGNIGIGIPGGYHNDLQFLLKCFIKDMVNDDYEIINTFRDCVPCAKPLATLVKENVMITGDAARLVDAPTGAGINNALFSGSLAGHISSNYIAGKIVSIELYEKLLTKKVKILNRSYRGKDNALVNDKIFLKKYNRSNFLLSHIHKLAPGFSEGLIARRLKKDQEILRIFKDKPFFYN